MQYKNKINFTPITRVNKLTKKKGDGGERTQGSTDGNEGGNMEFVEVFIVIMRDKRPCALHDDDQIDGTHPKHAASTHANTLTAKKTK